VTSSATDVRVLDEVGVVAVGDPAVVIAKRSRDNQGSLGAGLVPGPHLLVEGVGVVGAGEPVIEALLAPAAAGAYGEADQGLGLGRCAIDASEYASDVSTVASMCSTSRTTESTGWAASSSATAGEASDTQQPTVGSRSRTRSRKVATSGMGP